MHRKFFSKGACIYWHVVLLYCSSSSLWVVIVQFFSTNILCVCLFFSHLNIFPTYIHIGHTMRASQHVEHHVKLIIHFLLNQHSKQKRKMKKIALIHFFYSSFFSLPFSFLAYRALPMRLGRAEKKWNNKKIKSYMNMVSYLDSNRIIGRYIQRHSLISFIKIKSVIALSFHLTLLLCVCVCFFFSAEISFVCF